MRAETHLARPPVTLADKVRFLSDSGSYRERPLAVELRETHMSYVFLTPAAVFKLKKPITNAYVDFRTLDARGANCRIEVQLNRRLAPQVYRGVVALTESCAGTLALKDDGEVVEWLVHMERLPDARMLDHLILHNLLLPADVAVVGRRLGEFAVQPAVEIGIDRHIGQLRRQLEISRGLLARPQFALAPATLATVHSALSRFLDGGAELAARVQARRIVEGHGDLRPEHVCLHRTTRLYSRAPRSCASARARAAHAGEVATACARLSCARGPSVRKAWLKVLRDVSVHRPGHPLPRVYRVNNAPQLTAGRAPLRRECIDLDHYVADVIACQVGAQCFTGHLDALPEGTVCFGNEPMLRVSAPLREAQFVESRVMNLLHFQTVVASKAARCVLAARGKPLIDFGLRRAHGAEAGLLSARASYIAGFAGTATALAGAVFGIPVFGAMAHSFIQAHDDEAHAFAQFARAQPDNAALLIDTYDTEAAARKVVQLAGQLRAESIRISAVRIDSGDLAAHARNVRRILDTGGQKDITIFASGNLDEYRVAALRASGAPIDAFGIGTRMNVAADAPFLDCAYKLTEYAGRGRRKRSEGKATWPGRKQIFRRFDAGGQMNGDTVTLDGEPERGTAMLAP